MEEKKELMEKETEKKVKEETANVAEEEAGVIDFMKIKLSKTYDFEGEKISELDLNRLEELTGADMVSISRMMKRRGNTDASPEMTMEFAFFAAMQATGHPLEFFYGLTMKDSMKVKARVNYFLMY